MSTDRELLRIVALVKMNAGLAYVFNRPTSLRYREEIINGGRYMIGQDGPIVDCLGFEMARGSMRAFSGRELALPMEDGTTRKVKDHWWSCVLPKPGYVSIAYSCVKSLSRCYVFGSGQCEIGALEQMRTEYEQDRNGGCVYPYWDYEKVLNFDPCTRDLRDQVRRLERVNKSIIAEARRQAQRADLMGGAA